MNINAKAGRALYFLWNLKLKSQKLWYNISRHWYCCLEDPTFHLLFIFVSENSIILTKRKNNLKYDINHIWALLCFLSCIIISEEFCWHCFYQCIIMSVQSQHVFFAHESGIDSFDGFGTAFFSSHFYFPSHWLLLRLIVSNGFMSLLFYC
jgi:hypothetical protein